MVTRVRPSPVCEVCGTSRALPGVCGECFRWLEVKATFRECESAGAYDHGLLAVPESTTRTWNDWHRTHADLDARPFWRTTVAVERGVIHELAAMLGPKAPKTPRPVAGSSEAADLARWVAGHSGDVPLAELRAFDAVYRCRTSVRQSARQLRLSRQNVITLLDRLCRRWRGRR